MDPRLERLFEFREEYQMEVDKALKVQLLIQMRAEIERFLKGEQSAHDCLGLSPCHFGSLPPVAAQQALTLERMICCHAPL